jgi:hypothetical protein
MTRFFACTALLLALSGCAIADLTTAANQLGLTPDASTFRTLDCDGNGGLSQGETTARVFVRTSVAPTLHNVTPAEFQAADADKDGKWSQAEFSSALVATQAWSVSPGGCN